MVVGEGYRAIFHAEAEENQKELNTLFAKLEKDHSSRKSIDAIFKITRTLKGNALGMGFKPIGVIAHALEDVFAQIRLGNLVIDKNVFRELKQGLVVLSALIDGLKTGEKIKYFGAKAKLNVLLNLDEEKRG